MDQFEKVMDRLRHEVIEKTGPSCQLKAIIEDILGQFEAEIGYPLPPDYRRFLQKYGGVAFSDHTVAPGIDPRLDVDDFFSLSTFLGFYGEGIKAKCSLDMFYNYRCYKSVLPVGVVPFAESGDNRFAIACASADNGRVYCFVPGSFADDDDMLYLIAHRFTDFMDTLTFL